LKPHLGASSSLLLNIIAVFMSSARSISPDTVLMLVG
jgi:hypothetical protein